MVSGNGWVDHLLEDNVERVEVSDGGPASPGTQSQVTPAHAKHLGRSVELESRVTHPSATSVSIVVLQCIRAAQALR